MFSGNEKKLPKTGRGEMASFLYDFIDRKGNPQDWIFAGEPAIAAAVNALIRKIKRCEQPHRPSKMLTRQRAGAGGQAIELGIISRRNQRAKSPNRLAFFQRQIVEYACEFHDVSFILKAGSASWDAQQICRHPKRRVAAVYDRRNRNKRRS